MNNRILVSVIIPTLASAQRAPTLARAIESVRLASSSSVQLIVVVNGNRHDKDVCDWLKSQPDVRFDYQETPSAPKAVLRGRDLVTSDFFSTLDDDDEFLAGALDARMRLMQDRPDIDLVVTNGYRNTNGVDAVLYQRLADVPENPVQTLMDFNWLNSGNALYRTSSFDRGYFADSHPFGEWTWLAYKLAMDGKKICVSDEPTFRINDTQNSLSKSENYRNSYLPLFQRMLDYAPPRDVAKSIRRKMGAAWHEASDASMQNGDRTEAFAFHMRSLLHPGGLKYLSYSRRFLMPKR